jgi:NAD(P)-dependent dehydrogenase (short-subunit alcohol dehydrogenase family)
MVEHKPLIIVAGAGAGLGQSLLARFETEGFVSVGLGRTRPSAHFGTFHQVDLCDQKAVGEIIAAVMSRYGPPKVVVHNAAELVIAPLMQTTVEDFQRTWSSMVQSAFLLAQATMQPMVRGGGGSFLVSGATASLRGGARFSAFASAKFALRGLTQSLAREYQSAGIHVAHVIVDGIVDSDRSRKLHALDPSKMMKPDEIADAYWQLARQPRSAWTHELDLRPSSENF